MSHLYSKPNVLHYGPRSGVKYSKSDDYGALCHNLSEVAAGTLMDTRSRSMYTGVVGPDPGILDPDP